MSMMRCQTKKLMGMPVLSIHEHDAIPDEKLISMPVLSIHGHDAMPDENTL